MLENSIRENARYFRARDLVIFGYFCEYFYRYFCMRRIFLLRCVFPTRFLATRFLAARFLAIFLLVFSLLVSLAFMGACANRGSVSSKQKYSRKYSRESCPNIFVAESFSTKSILDELRSTTHELTFTKVRAFCKRDKQGLLLLDLSFNFLLEPVFSKGVKDTKGAKGSGRQRRLFLPLFAIASEDEKTIFSRTDKSLEVRFNSSGRASGRWLLALPSSSSSSSSLSELSSSSNFSLYLGFAGSDELFPLRSLLEERG